ncbi:membrane protein [Brevibacillus parabrevis]|uniref:Membrane protein n=1 Tax=Brevibacillus parabrevis TaxID=54914 RepID=A0A4Y3PIU6_BREPA|nr:DUF418 domain-containing protein [Brevibacillus parabrevis]GEB33217.1 membrane protein [Brevibacillus parabrevis]
MDINQGTKEVIILTALAPTGTQRIDTLDTVRGFALLGIILVNILPLLDVKTPTPGSLDAWLFQFFNFAVESRFFVIFSFLFGVGFHLFVSRAKAKGANSTVLFVRRLLALLAFGFVHKMFHPGEALFIYAIFGFMLMPFYRLKARTNLIVGLILAMFVCSTGFKPMLVLPLFILGLSVGQFGVFQDIPRFLPAIKKVQGIAFVLMLVGLYAQYHFLPADPFMTANMIVVDDMSEEQLLALTYYTIALTSTGFVMSAFYVTTLIRLLQHSGVQKALAPLTSYGRMALTNYVGQTVLILVGGYLFGWYGTLTYWQSTLFCLGIYVGQMAFSMLWLSAFRMGPLEWIWRVFTYLQVTPLRKDSNGKRSLA